MGIHGFSLTVVMVLLGLQVLDGATVVGLVTGSVAFTARMAELDTAPIVTEWL
jgi:hypothetical protein